VATEQNWRAGGKLGVRNIVATEQNWRAGGKLGVRKDIKLFGNSLPINIDIRSPTR
jgi:hypothetical protein